MFEHMTLEVTAALQGGSTVRARSTAVVVDSAGGANGRSAASGWDIDGVATGSGAVDRARGHDAEGAVRKGSSRRSASVETIAKSRSNGEGRVITGARVREFGDVVPARIVNRTRRSINQFMTSAQDIVSRDVEITWSIVETWDCFGEW